MRVLFEVAPVDRDVLQCALDDDDGFGDYEDVVAHEAAHARNQRHASSSWDC